MTKELVGFVGTGHMGGPMTLRLLAAGYDVCIYDRDQKAVQALVKKGAVAAKSAADVANRAETIFLSLPNPEIVNAVALGKDGLIEGKKVKRVIDFSTVGPKTAVVVFKGLSAKKVSYVDAPVSGGVKAATEGTLVMMMGGSDQDVAKVKEIVKSYAKTITHIGGVGHGQVAKLCNQIAQVINIQGVAESLRFAQANGADLQKVFEAISGGMAGSRMLDLMGPKMVSRDFKAGIEARLHAKDFFLVKDAATKSHLDMPALQTVAVQLEKLMESGWGYDDTSSLLKVLEA